MQSKNAITIVEINPLIAKRWSPRAFDPDKKVSYEKILALCEAARWAPSCYGDEPWRFMIFDKFSDEYSYERALECVVEWNRKWVKNAPVLMVAAYDTQFRAANELNEWAEFDTGAACQNIYLQAFSDGLAAHPFAGFDNNMFRNNFNIPKRYQILVMIAIGYQAEAETLESPYLESEIKERGRRPIALNFFKNSWERPIFNDLPID